MEQSRTGGATAPGPGNKTIATTLLELLAVRGRAGARARGERALGLAEGGLALAPGWLEAEALDRLFSAVDLDEGLARAVGHRLSLPDASGLALYGLGLATPEKAYRRLQHWLPRRSRESAWRVESMGDAEAVLVFDGSPAEPPIGPAPGERGRVAAAHCALRRGQLEAVPGLYGLLPATVTSSRCLARGDDHCRYAVEWHREAATGRRHGAVIGGASAVLFLAIGVFFGDGPAWPPVLLAAACVALGLTAGRMFDLHRQLVAVAGARRGHLALFDQVDAVLAEKLDQLARLDATLEGGPTALRRPERGESTFEEDPLAIVELGPLVARVVEKARPQVADWAEIRVESDAALHPVVCDPAQIERVVDELLQNAIEASLGAGDAPLIAIALRNDPRGVELTIADQGRGLGSEEVDETFDPFFEESPIGFDRGMGLPACLRIVEAHGGELRIASAGRTGTRVTILLPAADDSAGAPVAPAASIDVAEEED